MVQPNPPTYIRMTRSPLQPSVRPKRSSKVPGTRKLTYGPSDASYVTPPLISLLFHPYNNIPNIPRQVFELLVPSPLFQYKPREDYNLDAPTAHLWQMMVFTGERFTAEQLQASNDADLYFDSTCSSSFPPITCIINSVHTSTGTLKSPLPKFRNPFALSLRNYKVLPEPDVL